MSVDVKISVNAWKAELENDLCRCCHAEGSFKNLNTSYYWMDGEAVVYDSMLRECFNIELIGVKDNLQQMLCAICYNCIQRLEEAVQFKRQVLKCETRFQNIYMGYTYKEPVTEVAIKEEIPDTSDTSNAVVDIAPYHNGATNLSVFDTTSNNGGDDACDADDGQDDTDYQPGIQEVDKSSRHKIKKYTPGKGRKVAVVNIPVLPHDPEYIKNEEVIDTIQGVIKIVKRNSVKRDIHFKQTEDAFQCLKCPATFKGSHGIRQHVRVVHMNVPKYSCPTCSKTFRTQASFTKHKLEEHNIDHRFKCNACEHAFNTKIQLKRHINTFHMLGVKIKCKECDYETFSVESLYKHKFKHKTVKDFQCKYCRKAFVRKATLQLHERIHTGDRRKVCSVCGQAFVQKASLNYHMTKYHPEVAY